MPSPALSAIDMKTIFSLFLLTLAIGCGTHKTAVSHLDSREEGNAFIDSLLAADVDTVIGYYQGCVGCVKGLPLDYYIYWLDETEKRWKIKRFSTYARYEILQRGRPPMSYLERNLDSIETGRMKPFPEFSHFSWESIRIILGERSFEYKVEEMERQFNDSSPRVIFIDKIRSELLGLTGYWRRED